MWYSQTWYPVMPAGLATVYWKRGENEPLVKSAYRTHFPLTAVRIMT